MHDLSTELDQDLWQNILNKLEDHINEDSFSTWFTDTTLVDLNNDTLTIRVPTKFSADFMNQNYCVLISDISFHLYNKKYNVNFISNPLVRVLPKPSPGLEPGPNGLLQSRINPRYTFEQFVVGNNNRFAHSASLAVADSPGSSYNPLFIHGESGMGKTHLMQAIGNYVQINQKDVKVWYTTTEDFTNEMIEAIRTKNMTNFRSKYRNVDLLLVDDIHFLSKKESTQEEFFHTFNTLYENKKQIVITADRPVQQIQFLENRLISRFQWGLVADLKNPEFETRVAILRKKAENEGVTLHPTVMEFIAENIDSSVRALEGSLIRIIAYCSCNNFDPEDLDIDMARTILSNMISEHHRDINMDTIMQKVCQFYLISPAQIFDKTRKKNIALPRQVAMYLSNLLIPNMTLKDIADYYKRKDHTTVLHAKKLIETQFRNDNDFRAQIETMIKSIRETDR